MGPALKTVAFSVAAPGALAGFVPWRLLHGWTRLSAGLPGIAGLLIVAAGTACYLSCALDFVVVGRGTPAPVDPPKVLVARRLYRFVRNPMYVAVLLALLGQALAFRSGALAIYAAMIALLVHLFVTLYEEPTLRVQFGPAYDEYCRTAGRWLPRLRRAG